MNNRNNAYDRFKNKNTKSGIGVIDSFLSKEETYWAGATGISMIFVGILDGGISMAIAYGARKLYEKRNG